MDSIDKISTFGFIGKAGGILTWYAAILMVGIALIYVFSEISDYEITGYGLMKYNLFAGSVCYSIGAIAVARGLFKRHADNFATISWTLFSILLSEVTLYEILNYLITDGDYSRFHTWINLCFYVLEIIVWFIAGISLLYNYKSGKVRMLGFAMLIFLAWRLFSISVFVEDESSVVFTALPSLTFMLLCDILMTFAFLWIMSNTYKKS